MKKKKGVRIGLLMVMLLSLAQCGREELSVTVRGAFTVEREPGRGGLLELEGRALEAQLAADAFAAVWDAVAGRGGGGSGPSGQGIALTLTGGGPRDDAGVSVLAGMVLNIPVPLQAGVSYSVTSTFAPPSVTDMPMYWNSWGRRTLARSGEAEIALFVFDYHSVGMRKEHVFVATGVTGTVRVLTRLKDHTELRLDLTATDDAGASLRLRGDFTATNERYTPPIT